MIRRQALFQSSNRRDAVALGLLLAVIIAVAFFVVIRIYTELDTAAGLERRVVASERRVSNVLQNELDEVAALRGYLATNQPFFLEQSRGAARDFEVSFQNLETAADSLHDPELQRTVERIRDVHRDFEDTVAQPLARHPKSKDALTWQTLGKILIDQFRRAIARADTLLNDRLSESQTDLRRTIDQSLFGGLATVVIFGAIGFTFVASRTQMLATIDRGRSIVETLQGAFRTDLDAVPGISIGTAYLSATKDAAVGGDLYDVRRIDATRGLVIVADVSGKGVEAAVNTAFVKYSIRTLAHAESSPARILEAFNTLFLETIKNPNLFVVTFIGVFDARYRRLTYASAGHSGAYLRTHGDVRPLDVTGTVIGLDASFTYEERAIDLEPGDLVLLATDGLTEARDVDGDVLDDRGAMALLAEAPEDAQGCADYLAAAVRSRSGNEPADDLAIIAIAVDRPGV